MRLRALLTAALFLCARTLPAGETVRLEKRPNAVVVTIDGTEFTTFHHAPTQPKPYFSPVRTADGGSLTRPLENPKDHPHHRGIWVSVDEVNEVDFWAERGKIATHSVELIKVEGNPAQFKVVNHWLGPDNNAILVETTTITIHADRLFEYDITLTPGEGERLVSIHDTKEGLFGLRVCDSLREVETGKVVNADGKQGTAACWGQTSAWVDYSGMVEGKAHGVALFDHPDNPRKSRYHVRDYGLFTLSPFGQSAYTMGKLPADPLELPAGKTFRLRYGLFIHRGDAESGGVAERYKEYVAGAAR